MKKKKILIVFGTRPEAIKLAPVVEAAKEKLDIFDIGVCITGQHREMLDQVLKIFNIPVDHDLNIMKPNQDLFDITSNTLQGLKKVFIDEKPNLIIVQGDTTTAFIAGLAAFYLKIPIGHVEAGLRTYNKYSPFPEEKNRHLLSTLVDYHFAPTDWAKQNLTNEGVKDNNIWVTGNTVIDALLMIVEKQKLKAQQDSMERYFSETLKIPLLKENTSQKIILVTGHRRENFGEGFNNICLAIKEIAHNRKDASIIYPVHLNPNVQGPVKSILSETPNVHLIEPLEYEHFIYLMDKSYIILSDSGGIQEEGPSLGKPVLVMRDTTERPEGVTAGVVKLVGTNKEKIIKETIGLFDDKTLYKKMSTAVNPYGDGKSSQRILNILVESPLNK